MIMGDTGEKTAEKGRHKPTHSLDCPGALSYLHYTHPQGEHSCKSEAYLKGEGGLGERGIHYLAPYLKITCKNGLSHSHQEGYDEEGNPYPVEYHIVYFRISYRLMMPISTCSNLTDSD